MPASQATNETRLPRAVLRQSADVQAKIADREKQRAALLNPEPEPPAESQASTTVEPPPPSPPPAPPAPATPSPTSGSDWRGTMPPQDDARFNDPAYWRQRFTVTEGRIAAIERERRTERSSWQTQVASLQEEVRTLKAATPAPALDITKLFTADEIKEYGEEQCRVVATAATAAASKQAREEIEARLKPIEEARARDLQTQKEDRLQAFRDQVTALYPDWQTVDKDPRWLDWLMGEDSNGIVRQTLLDAQIARSNARGVAAMFQAWTASVTPPAPPVPPVVPHGGGASGDAPAAPAPSQVEVQGLRHPTPAEKRDFYKRCSVNQGRGVTAEERAQFEARMKLPNPYPSQ